MPKIIDHLHLVDHNHADVQLFLSGDEQRATLRLEATGRGHAQWISITLDAVDLDALWEELSYRRSLRGL